MKMARLLLLFVVWLAACSPRATTVSTSISVAASALPSTETPVPANTATFAPSATSIPKPDAVTYIYPEGEIVFDRTIIEKTVNFVYPQYVNMGCGEFGPIRIYASANLGWLRQNIASEYLPYDGDFAGYAVPGGAIFINTDWITWKQRTTLGWRESFIAYELANACQMILMGGKNPTLTNWRFMTTGASNSLASRVIIPWLGAFDGKPYKSFEEYRTKQLKAAHNHCSVGLNSLDAQDGSEAFYVEGEAAWNVLVRDDLSLWSKYHLALKHQKKEDAFKETFGMTLEEFEASFKVLCENQLLPTPTSTEPPPSSGISGKVILGPDYSKLTLNEYHLSFCGIGGKKCLGSPPLESNGEFFMPLVPGYYFISLNSTVGGPPIGWYLSTGMAESNSCGGLIQVSDNKITNIEFKVNSPVPCP